MARSVLTNSGIRVRIEREFREKHWRDYLRDRSRALESVKRFWKFRNRSTVRTYLRMIITPVQADRKKLKVRPR